MGSNWLINMSQREIGDTDGFAEGKATKVDVEGIEIAVVNIDGEYYGISNKCIHKNLPMDRIGDEQIVSDELREDDDNYTYGEINKEEKYVRCPWHFLKWDLETGFNPILKKSIPIFDIEEHDGKLYIEI